MYNILVFDLKANIYSRSHMIHKFLELKGKKESNSFGSPYNFLCLKMSINH